MTENSLQFLFNANKLGAVRKDRPSGEMDSSQIPHGAECPRITVGCYLMELGAWRTIQPLNYLFKGWRCVDAAAVVHPIAH